MTPRPRFNQKSFRSYYTHKYWKNHYQNIPATKYAMLRAISLQNVMQNIESNALSPLLNPCTNTNHPPPLPTPIFFFCFFKNLLRLKINILSSFYPEINFPAEPVVKINNLSRPHLPAPPLRIKWSSPYIPRIPQSPELPVGLKIVVQMYLLEPMQRELSLIFHRHLKLGHLDLFQVPIYVI